jgi:hypothetical protein
MEGAMSHVPTRVKPEEVIAARAMDLPANDKLELSPPYLRELPMELIQHEREYRIVEFSSVSRITMHSLWILFRICYHLGWKKAERDSLNMPHLKLQERMSR